MVPAQQRDAQATKAAILDAAETEFLANGYGATATSAIARRAGLTKSLIHHHFGSKHGLWRAVKLRRFEVYANEQLAMLENAEATPELLGRSMETYFRFLRDNPEVVRVLAWIYLEQDDDDECLAAERPLIEAGVAKVREGQEAGGLRSDVDPRFVLFAFLGLVQHWFHNCAAFKSHVGGQESADELHEAYLEDTLKIFFEGVLPR